MYIYTYFFMLFIIVIFIKNKKRKYFIRWWFLFFPTCTLNLLLILVIAIIEVKKMQKISLTLSILSCAFLWMHFYAADKNILIAFYCNIKVERRDIYHVCLVIRQHMILSIIFSFSGSVVLTRKALNPSSFLSLNIKFIFFTTFRRSIHTPFTIEWHEENISPFFAAFFPHSCNVMMNRGKLLMDILQ